MPNVVKNIFGEIKDAFEESAIGHAIDIGSQVGRRLTVRTYPTQWPRRFRYPETRHPNLRNKYDLGVAFSGGGTRSASLSMGQMRALRQMQVDRLIKYIGAISGGSWFAVPYTYLPSRIDDDSWMGTYGSPEGLVWNRVRSADGHGILTKQITKAELWFAALGDLVKANLLSGFTIPIVDIKIGLDDVDEVFSRAIERVFLEEIGLAGNRYAAWDLSDVDKLIIRHKKQVFADPNLDRRDFRCVQKDRPYLLVNGAMNQDFGKFPDGSTRGVLGLSGFLTFDHVEFTPLYSGVHRRGRGRLNINTGGGYVENIGWDTWLPVALNDNRMRVSPSLDFHRLSLKDIMGTSGAAPAYLVNAVNKATLRANGLKIFPRFRYWSPHFVGKPITVERPFGDGGYVDNFGVIPLLKRGVRNIIACLNTNTSITTDTTWPLDIRLDKYLPVLFGQSIPSDGLDDLSAPSVFLNQDRNFGAGKGKVFASGYNDTVRGLLKTKQLANTPMRQGKTRPKGRLSSEQLKLFDFARGLDPEDYENLISGPIYHLGRYQTVDNDFFGIHGGQTVQILWVYNEKSLAWSERLHPDISSKLGKGVLESFPQVETFMGGGGPHPDKDFWQRLDEGVRDDGLIEGLADTITQRAEFIDLHPEQVNLMANLSAWALLQLQPIIDENLLPSARPKDKPAIPMSLRDVLQSTKARSLQGAIASMQRQGGSAFPREARESFRRLVTFINR